MPPGIKRQFNIRLDMPLSRFTSRRNFLKISGSAAASTGVKRARENVISRLNPFKRVVAIAKNVSAARDVQRLANGGNIKMSRRAFLKGTAKRAATKIAANPNRLLKPLTGAVGNTVDPIGAAGRLSGVKLGRVGKTLLGAASRLGLFKRPKSRIARF
jgi:hypothetical protein